MKTEKDSGLVFSKENYTILLVGVALIVIGFIIMSGGGSEDPKVFSPEIFNQRRLTVAPIVVLSGFAVVMYSIMKKSGKSAE